MVPQGAQKALSQEEKPACTCVKEDFFEPKANIGVDTLGRGVMGSYEYVGTRIRGKGRLLTQLKTSYNLRSGINHERL